MATALHVATVPYHAYSAQKVPNYPHWKNIGGAKMNFYGTDFNKDQFISANSKVFWESVEKID